MFLYLAIFSPFQHGSRYKLLLGYNLLGLNEHISHLINQLLERLSYLHSFYSNPFVDGTPFTRELLRLAASNARPKALKIASIIRSEEHTSELQSRGHLVCRL